MDIIKLFVYTTDSGRQPYADWQRRLDAKAKSIVVARLARIKQNHLGDCKKITGSNIWELRIDYGPGYRIYFAKQEHTLIILLAGGDKGSQSRDIKKAQEYWLAYRGKKHG